MRGLIALTLLLTALSLAGCERYALDRQMEELCKKDGGVKVYETVRLPASEFEKLRSYATTAISVEDYYGPNFRYVQKTDILVGSDATDEDGKGQLAREYQAIYHRSDGRLLGESTQYRRSGGDGFTFGFQPSGKVCPWLQTGLIQSVLVKGE